MSRRRKEVRRNKHLSFPSDPFLNICSCRIQISQETDQVVWYPHLLKNFPQSIVIHTIKGFGIVNKAEIDRA